MSFFGLNIASQGMFTARTGLDVTGHNIANIKTPGYSRQQINQKASRPISYGTNIGMFGTGSEVVNIKRVRDVYFDHKFWAASSILGEYESKAMHMDQIQKLFNEPSESDAGFIGTFNNFFDSLQTLSTNPSDDSYKAKTVGMASSFTEYIRRVATDMTEYQKSLNSEVKQVVNEINDRTILITRLNEQIRTIELSGQQANDLRDERDKLIDELSAMVPVQVNEKEDPQGYPYMEIKLNGETLVSHKNMRLLKIEERDYKMNPEDADGLYDVYWDNGNKLDINHKNMTGELNALIEMRDGNNSANFSGTIDSATATQIVIKDGNRFDIPKAGQIRVGTQTYNYKDVQYDSSTGELTLIIDGTIPDPTKVQGTATIGEPINSKGIPYYLQKLNNYARKFASEINKIHKQGQFEDGTHGGAFFVAQLGDASLLDENDPFSYTQITAKNFSVSEDIVNDASLFATRYAASTGESDNNLVLDLIKIKNSKEFGNSDPANYMEMLIADVGIDAKKASTFYQNQTTITHTVSNQRLSISSVDINEETMNMVRYQQAYNVAAKMIQTFDEICDVTINGLIK